MTPIMLTETSGISNFLQDVPSVFNSATTMITNNPVAALFVGISIVAAGIGLFRKVTRRRG